jgi:predicted nucleotide-binding protein
MEGEDLTAKREAALKPRILGEFIRQYDNSPLPRREIGLNVLVDMGVPKERVESVYSMILDTAASVGFIREIKNKQFIDLSGVQFGSKDEPASEEGEKDEQGEMPRRSTVTGSEGEPVRGKELGKGIFVAHGKNKKPLEQLKRILDQFKVPYKVAIEEPNLGRPISEKIKQIMQSCNCAILIFTADEEFFDKDGKSIWRPSENVVYELGASGYLYESSIVILKEDVVEFPSNFRDIGYISFSKDQLEAKSMDVIRELIGFGILKITT